MSRGGTAKEWPMVSEAEQMGDVDVRITDEQRVRVRRLVAVNCAEDPQAAVQLMQMLGVHPDQADEYDLDMKVTGTRHLNRMLA